MSETELRARTMLRDIAVAVRNEYTSKQEIYAVPVINHDMADKALEALDWLIKTAP